MPYITVKGRNGLTSEAYRSNPLFLRNGFQTDGVFDLPVIRRQAVDLKEISLIGYDQTRPDEDTRKDSYVHFFLDDYKFEVLWKDPQPRLDKLRQYRGVLSPQFSAYYTMPNAMQLYNMFRSRWCGAYLQSQGLTVIPTVYWGLPQSYWYCFDGIEKGSVVAVSTLGVKREKHYGQGHKGADCETGCQQQEKAICNPRQGVHIAFSCGGIQRGRSPFWHTTLRSKV